MTYALEIDGLADDVDRAAVTTKHAALVAAIRRNPTVAGVHLLTNRGDAWLARRKVITALGAVVADDHEAWLAAELARDGGNAATTVRRLRVLGYRLTECAVDSLYLVHDRGGPRQDDFVQIEVDVEEERVDRRLFAERDYWLETPRDLAEVVRLAEEGDRLGEEQRVLHRPIAYRLRRAFDAGAFMREAAIVEAAAYAAQRSRRLMVSQDDGPPRMTTAGELADEMSERPRPAFVWKGQRLINDWTLSSAGRAGRRFCESWALDIADYTSPKGERSMGVVPLWTHTRKMAKIERMPKGGVYELFGKLESLDRRLGVPMAWYFYMLHGNLVQDWAGRRVLEAAEAGKIVLPEHDYQILRRWNADGYGF